MSKSPRSAFTAEVLPLSLTVLPMLQPLLLASLLELQPVEMMVLLLLPLPMLPPVPASVSSFSARSIKSTTSFPAPAATDRNRV